jgi:hypothetical protein
MNALILFLACIFLFVRMLATVREKHGLGRYRASGDLRALVNNPLWKMLKGFSEWSLLLLAILAMPLFGNAF